eukprot:6122462-Prorocentrum_lima.AAC.1
MGAILQCHGSDAKCPITCCRNPRAEPGKLTRGELEAIRHLLLCTRRWDRVGLICRPRDMN